MTALISTTCRYLRPHIGKYRAQKRHVLFRYSIGDLCLFRIGFDILMLHIPFDPIVETFAIPQRNPEFPNGIDVICYEGAVVAQGFPRVRLRGGGFYYVPNRNINYYIDLRQSFSDYLKGFSGKTRSTLRRKVRQLTKDMEFRYYRTVEEVLEFHQAARQVALKTYQEKLFDGAIPDSSEFVARMRTLAAHDNFRGFILFFNDRPVSYLYLPIENGTVIYRYLGYDPDYAKLSVGTVLLYLALDKIFSEGVHRYFDFTSGKGQTKILFGRAACFRADIYFFRWTMSNVVTMLGHLGMQGVSAGIGRILSVLGLRHKVRKVLRRL